MILTELYRTDDKSAFEETELYISAFNVHSASINRDSREYYGQTEVVVDYGDDFMFLYVKQSPSEISKLIEAENAVCSETCEDED